jgi:hypothetical protein
MKIQKRRCHRKKDQRTIKQRIAHYDTIDSPYYRGFIKDTRRRNIRVNNKHAGLRKCGLICYSNDIIQCIASCSYLTDFLQCPLNEEHGHFQLYFEFTSVINSVVSGGDVVNLKKLNSLYRSNEYFKQDKGKYHYNPMDKRIYL